MVTLLRQIHRAYSLLILFILSLVFYPFYFLASRNPRGYRILNELRKLNSFLSSALIGVFYLFEFEKPLEKGRTYIYCANHASNFDIMIMCMLAEGRFFFMGKEELLRNPVLKLFFETIDVPVNRDSKISAFRAFKRAGENLDKGMSLVIFPEGRIDENQLPPAMLPFKNGPFRLAIEKNIAIVPVSLIDVWKKMWDDGSKHGSSPGFCHIYVHQPVFTDELKIDDSDSLKDRIFELINSKLHQDDHR